MRLRLRSVLLVLALAACRRHPRPPAATPAVSAPEAAVAEAPVAEAPVVGDDLLPGTVSAFGLIMPTVTREDMNATDMKVFHVEAPMPRVMRYLEHRLEMHDADIHPLAAMVHRAIVRDVQANLIVDVGVRDEGDRTMVTVWNRTPPPSPPQTIEQGLRAVGVDPSTGQYAPEMNR